MQPLYSFAFAGFNDANTALTGLNFRFCYPFGAIVRNSGATLGDRTSGRVVIIGIS